MAEANDVPKLETSIVPTAVTATTAATATRSRTIARGSHVILRDGEGAQKVVFLGASTKDFKMGKYPLIPAEAVLSVPYGAALRRNEDGQWLRCRRVADDDAPEEEPSGEITGSNQHLTQDNTAQALSPTEVSDLKSSLSGEQVVEAIAAHSSSFTTKTKFAQDKYLKKKRQKHVQQVTLLRPTLFDLCETYMKESRKKICGLRFDYLSSILCQADVRSGGRFFVLDCAMGLVVSAMAQQLASTGKVYRAIRGGASTKAIDDLDLGEARYSVRVVPLEVLQSSDPWAHNWLTAPPDAAETTAPQDGSASVTAAAADGAQAAKIERTREKVKIRCADVRDLLDNRVDAVVIVAGEEEHELCDEALDAGMRLLRPGGRVVVYGPHLQPIVARQGAMRADAGFVDVRMTQLFTREYQVLPQRTHPLMTADAQLLEGFILTASKVATSEGGRGSDKNAEAETGEKRRRVA